MSQTLKNIRTKHQLLLLREAIDQRTIDSIIKALESLELIVASDELADITTLHHAFVKAHEDLSNVLSYGDIKKWAYSLLPKKMTALGKVIALINSVQSLIKQLPALAKIAIPYIDEDDYDKKLNKVVQPSEANVLKAMIIKSVKPSDNKLFGLPYVKSSDLAEEVLTTMSINDIISLSEKHKNAKMLVPINILKQTSAEETASAEVKTSVNKQPATSSESPTEDIESYLKPRVESAIEILTQKLIDKTESGQGDKYKLYAKILPILRELIASHVVSELRQHFIITKK